MAVMPKLWILRAALSWEEGKKLAAAKTRVESLAELCPGEYVIYDKATGECVSVTVYENRKGSESSLG